MTTPPVVESDPGMRWLPSDTAFQVFLATITAADLSPYEYQLWQWHRLHGSAR